MASGGGGHPLYVHSLADNDVLLGRGTGPNEHVGNKRFRDAIKLRRTEFLNAKTPSDQKQLCAGIVALVHDNGGRFLKKVGNVAVKRDDLPCAGRKRKRVIYQVISDAGVLLGKVKSSFRYTKEKTSEKEASSSKDVGISHDAGKPSRVQGPLHTVPQAPFSALTSAQMPLDHPVSNYQRPFGGLAHPVFSSSRPPSGRWNASTAASIQNRSPESYILPSFLSNVSALQQAAAAASPSTFLSFNRNPLSWSIPDNTDRLVLARNNNGELMRFLQAESILSSSPLRQQVAAAPSLRHEAISTSQPGALLEATLAQQQRQHQGTGEGHADSVRVASRNIISSLRQPQRDARHASKRKTEQLE